MKNYLFVTDSGRRNEGLRNSIVRADTVEQATRLFNIESVCHRQNLFGAGDKAIDGVWLIKDSDSESWVATVIDLGEAK